MLHVLKQADALAANAILIKMSGKGAIAPAHLRTESSTELGYNGTEMDTMFALSTFEADESGKRSLWGRRADPSLRGSQTQLDYWPQVFADIRPSTSWVADLYRASRGAVTDEQIIGLFDALEGAIYSDFDGLDAALGGVDVKRLAPEFIVGIPRALFPLRDHLFNWRPFVMRAWTELSLRPRSEVNELLQGLL